MRHDDHDDLAAERDYLAEQLRWIAAGIPGFDAVNVARVALEKISQTRPAGPHTFDAGGIGHWCEICMETEDHAIHQTKPADTADKEQAR